MSDEMVEAILWDNDGVLVDTEEMFFSATCDALARAGVPLSRDFYVECVMTHGRTVFELVEARGWTKEQIGSLRKDRDAAYTAMLRSGCKAMNGVIETLRLLRGTTRMAVVTSSPRAELEVAHQVSGIRDFFELIVARENYVEFKPHPEPYLTALGLLQLPAESCIAVEDSARGLKSALAAGLRVVVIPNDLTRGSAFNGASAVLDSVKALPEFLKTL
jgi:HAD superfamily hydrolase (TIGR01509 family)